MHLFVDLIFTLFFRTIHSLARLLPITPSHWYLHDLIAHVELVDQLISANMDPFRERHATAKQADDARNNLIEDLLQKVDDMQKVMDRNAFVMVLIDGDCMNVCDASFAVLSKSRPAVETGLTIVQSS